jgi:hypothetical protein
MKQFLALAAVAAVSCLGAQAPPAPPKPAAPKTAPVPFRDESLRYSINWPSGLGLGEAQMQSSRTGDRWSFALSLDASVPGFAASDSYQSIAAGDFCAVEFYKEFTHGKRKARERTTFSGGIATRQTMDGGGKSEISIPACPRDALTFLYYLRREMADGRIPGPQTIYFGAPYQVRTEFAGKQTIRVSDKPAEADRLNITYKGPKSQGVAEVYLARDASRTPLIVRVPLVAGAFSMELVR